MAKKETTPNEHEENNMRLVKCKSRSCGEMFNTTRIDKFYCNDDCQQDEKIAVLRDKNNLIKRVVDDMLNNEKILTELYESRVFEITKDALIKKGFSLTANYLMIIDEGTGLYSMKYFNYGIKLIGEALFRIVYFVDDILKTK